MPRKKRWSATIIGNTGFQPVWRPFTFTANLDREPDRAFDVFVADPTVAREAAAALLRWAERATVEATVAYIAPDKTVTPDQLRPGLVVHRWTEPVGDHAVRAPMPCHDTQKITLPAVQDGDLLILCRKCGESFHVEILPEDDGGHAAWFTVAAIPAKLSHSRPR